MTLSLLPPPAASATDRTGHPRPASRAPSSWARTREAGLDWVLLGAVTALLTSGVVLVWSATSAREALTGARGIAGDEHAILGVDRNLRYQ